MTTTKPPKACSHCGSIEAVRIVYGLPTIEAFEASQRGEFRLGGCVIGEESPHCECRPRGAALPWVAGD